MVAGVRHGCFAQSPLTLRAPGAAPPSGGMGPTGSEFNNYRIKDLGLGFRVRVGGLGFNVRVRFRIRV